MPERRVLAALILLFSLLLFFELPGSWLIEPDEARYAEIPREMLATRDFVTPRLDSAHYFEKPPLLYWANAASIATLGPSAFAARLPTRLAGIATVAMMILAFGGSSDRDKDDSDLWGLWSALIYVTAIHVPIAGVALAPILLGLPPILYPMHVVLLELAIDPICALAFEGEPSEAAAMTRPPRRADEGLFGARQLGVALLQGAGILAGVLGVYLWALQNGPETEARGAAFLALVVGNLALALSDSIAPGGKLFARHRSAYWAIAGVTVFALSVALEAPWLEAIFRMTQPSPAVLALAIGVAVASGGWMRLLRLGGSRPAPASPAGAS